ncbi:hypothetical protein C0992_008002 [Termitomyces sp. T32_za158]|nr:hypothetical protein C0992_008002 [Termitomyces sp. T32_za158]
MPTSTNNPLDAVTAPPEQPPLQPQLLPTEGGEGKFVQAFGMRNEVMNRYGSVNISLVGTLTIGAGDQYTYYGRTARSELLIHAFGEHRPRTFSGTSRLSQQMIDASSSGSASCVSSTIKEAFGLLPPLSEAVRLCETYQEYGKFMQPSDSVLERPGHQFKPE